VVSSMATPYIVLALAMTFDLFGAGCFGLVIGFVAWHVFRAGESSFGVTQLAAFIGALLGAVVLAAFPAGTTLFAAYSSGLALGFFIVPVSRTVVSINQAVTPIQPGSSSEVADQQNYIEEHWPEVERVVTSALDRKKGAIRQYHLLALPLDEMGRVSVLRKYARTYPKCTSISQGFLGVTLRSMEGQQVSVST
jgi:hypothetical protein